MAIINVPLVNELNVSIQVGDIVYFCKPVNKQAGSNHPTTLQNTKPKRLGKITEIDRNNNILTVNIGGLNVNLNTNHYLMFSKDRRANMSGMLGYFMETEFKNESTLPAEIFATAVDFVESSK